MWVGSVGCGWEECGWGECGGSVVCADNVKDKADVFLYDMHLRWHHFLIS